MDAADERCADLSQLQDRSLGSSQENRFAATLASTIGASFEVRRDDNGPSVLGPLLFPLRSLQP